MLSKHEKEIFAILFASGEPVELSRISLSTGIEEETLSKLIRFLEDKLEENEFPVQLLTLGNKVQLATRPVYAEVIKKTLEIKRNMPLSQAAMEVLAIIAYNQPVTKSFVEQVRGVDSGSVVNSLDEKGLIEESGRLEIPGRPISYKTNANFLRCFGLNSIADLPQIDYNAQPEDTEILEYEDISDEQIDFPVIQE